jgi:hypothetical protein
MAAPVLLVPTDATWTAELAARTALTTGNAYWKVEVDDGGGFDDLTASLDNNGLSISAAGSVFDEATAAQAKWTFRNSPKVWTEGDLAGAPVRISAKIGAAAYIVVFTGYVSEQGCTRSKESMTDDAVSFTAYDPAKSRGLNRKMPPTAFLSYKVAKASTPTTSLAHALAAAMGLAVGDCDFYDVDETKDYVGVGGDTKPFTELQDLAKHYGALLHFRYDGKLRLALWTAAEWNSPTPEYVFDDANVHSFQAVGGNRFCNKCTTEWKQYQTLPAESIVYKNFDQWDDAFKRNAIVVAAGEYWPGGTDADAVGRLEYGFDGEKFPVGTDIVTPTIGASGSGSDIEYSGSGLTIVSFNGSTAATRQNVASSELILRNTSGSPITIRKFQVRGTPLRELAVKKVEHVDATVTDEWDEIEREVPGKYATTDALAKQIVRRYVDFGKEARKEYDAVVDWTPHLQIGTLVTFHPTTDVDLTCFVAEYTHTSKGPHTATRTRVRLVERVDYSATGAGHVTQQTGTGASPTWVAGEAIIASALYEGRCDFRCPGTDDHTAVENALAQASAMGYGSAYLTAGVYDFADDCEVPSNMRVRGSGASTLINFSGTGNCWSVVGSSGTHKENVTIEDMKVVLTIAHDYLMTGVRGTYVDNLKVTGLVFDGLFAAVYFDHCDQSTIDKNFFYDCYNGSFIVDSTRYTIYGNAFDNFMTAINVYTGSVAYKTIGNITKNTMKGNSPFLGGTGYAIVATAGIAVDKALDTVIEGNVIDGIALDSAIQVTSNCERVVVKGNLVSDVGTVYRNVGSGIRVAGKDILVIGNTCINCHGSGAGGIHVVTGAERVVVTGNVCRSNRNRFVNGECETGTYEYQRVPRFNGEASATLVNLGITTDTGVFYSGATTGESAKVTKSIAAGTEAHAAFQDSESTTDLHDQVPGETYHHSVFVRIPSSGGPAAAEVSLVAAYYVSGAWTETEDFASVQDAWEELHVDVTLPTNATGFKILLRIASTAENSEYAYLDHGLCRYEGTKNYHESQFTDDGTETKADNSNSWGQNSSLEWFADTYFPLGGICTHGGVTYIALAANQNVEPPNATYWRPFVAAVVTVSTSAPSGTPADGDLWLQRET